MTTRGEIDDVTGKYGSTASKDKHTPEKRTTERKWRLDQREKQKGESPNNQMRELAREERERLSLDNANTDTLYGHKQSIEKEAVSTHTHTHRRAHRASAAWTG